MGRFNYLQGPVLLHAFDKHTACRTGESLSSRARCGKSPKGIAQLDCPLGRQSNLRPLPLVTTSIALFLEYWVGEQVLTVSCLYLNQIRMHLYHKLCPGALRYHRNQPEFPY